MFEKEAEEGWQSKELWYKLNANEITYKTGFKDAYNKANEWHYVTDKLPPNPKENEDGISVQPLNYICAYECGDDGCGGIDYECDEFMYLGDGVWNGENKNYPIYAWLEHSVEVPKPRKR